MIRWLITCIFAVSITLVSSMAIGEDSTIQIDPEENAISDPEPSNLSNDDRLFDEYPLRISEYALDLSSWEIDTSSENVVNYAGLLDYAYNKPFKIAYPNGSMKIRWWLGFKDSQLEIVLFGRDRVGGLAGDEFGLLIKDLRSRLLDEFTEWELVTDNFTYDSKIIYNNGDEQYIMRGGQLHLINDNEGMIYLNWDGSFFTCSLKTIEYSNILRAYDEENLKASEEAARKALECPLEPIDGRITRDSANVPYVYAQWENVTDKTIDAYKVEIRCYDRFGDPVYYYTNRSNVFTGQAQHTIKPGRKTPSGTYWYMHGFDLLAEAKLKITKVHFTDGTVKYPKSDCETMTVYLDE